MTSVPVVERDVPRPWARRRPPESEHIPLPSQSAHNTVGGADTLVCPHSNHTPAGEHDMDQYREANRRLWDEWTEIHYAGAYPVDDVRNGWNSLWPLERKEVGDVSGKSLLHLQCHFGADTISWARLGATVTGIDFSPRGIARARELAAETNIAARFIESDLYALPGVLDETFDIVYTSYGVLTWLPNIRGWAETASRYVKPGGFLYVAELHPVPFTFDDTVGLSEIRPRYRYYSREEPEAYEVQGSYADPNARTEQKAEYGWAHGLGEIVSAVIDAGLRLEYLHEHPFTVHPPVDVQLERNGRYWRWKDPNNEIPLMFSLKAWKG